MSLQSVTSVVQGVQDLFTIRYVTIAGVVTMLYDHLLTISEERQYIWKAPHSITKYSFLFIRYLIIMAMIVILHEMCGFSDFPYSVGGCRKLFLTVACVSTATCIAVGILILQRILVLWKDSKRIQIFLWSMHVTSACVNISVATTVIKAVLPNVVWFPAEKTCNVSPIPSILPLFCGAPLFLEIGALILVIYNALATPRLSTVPFRRSLQKNGIFFFLAIIILRITVVVLIVSIKGTLSLVGIYFFWTSYMLFSNRSFLRLLEAKTKNQELPSSFQE